MFCNNFFLVRFISILLMSMMISAEESLFMHNFLDGNSSTGQNQHAVHQYCYSSCSIFFLQAGVYFVLGFENDLKLDFSSSNITDNADVSSGLKSRSIAFYNRSKYGETTSMLVVIPRLPFYSVVKDALVCACNFHYL